MVVVLWDGNNALSFFLSLLNTFHIPSKMLIFWKQEKCLRGVQGIFSLIHSKVHVCLMFTCSRIWWSSGNQIFVHSLNITATSAYVYLEPVKSKIRGATMKKTLGAVIMFDRSQQKEFSWVVQYSNWEHKRLHKVKGKSWLNPFFWREVLQWARRYYTKWFTVTHNLANTQLSHPTEWSKWCPTPHWPSPGKINWVDTLHFTVPPLEGEVIVKRRFQKRYLNNKRQSAPQQWHFPSPMTTRQGVMWQ